MTWSFRGQSFAVAADGTVIFSEWFGQKTETTIDPVLGGTTRYVDIGGVSYEPMSIVAQTTTTAARDTLIGYRGTTGTLTDDNSRSCTALLKDAQLIRVKTPTSGKYRLAVIFEFVS